MDAGTIKKWYYMYNNARTNVVFFLDKMRNRSLLAVKDNIKFKDIHKNQRCFILGNGPSLKEEDLSLLGDEIVFTVNQASRNPQFGCLRSNYHFWSDPNFFKIDTDKSEDLELLQTMQSVADDNHDLQCFFPVKQMDFVQRHGIDQKLHVNYYSSGLFLYDGYSKKIDYTKCVISFGTVVQWCITMAVYMGCTEIYLLGCDNTSIITTVKSFLHNNDDNDYSYEISENEKKRMENLLKDHSLEAFLHSYLRTLQDYRMLYAYCCKYGIRLINCSSETVIDSIPRMRLTDVINGK